MNFDKIKQEISISSYLKAIGWKPQFENDYTARYIAHYRGENNPSLSINKQKNLWYDHGLGKGGNIIQLVALINNCNECESARILTTLKLSFSFHCEPSLPKKANQLLITSVSEISNKYLIQYLHSRRIPIDIASKYCKEVHYENRGKHFYALGFPNNSGGYELRNKYFKGCTNKDISVIKATKHDKENECLIFEGFIDFLSYLALKKTSMNTSSIIVLNSISNIDKAIPILKTFDKSICYLDNDEAGKGGVEKIIRNNICAESKSIKYSQFKDLNEYLMSKSGAYL